jgi:predicted transposase/invertase (TIGR01784 family)
MEVDNKRIDIEIQVEKEKDYPERTLYYCADLYTSHLQSGKGNEYGNAPQTIIISIINFILFADCGEHVSRFSMLEETRHSQLTDKMKLVYYELPKLPEPTGPKDRLTLWLSLFKARTEDDLAKLESMGVPVIQEAIETYHSVVASEEFQELERQRRIAERDYQHDIAVAERKIETKYQSIIAKERAEREKERAEREALERKIQLLEAQIEKEKR